MELSTHEYDEIALRLQGLMDELYEEMDNDGVENASTILSEKEAFVLEDTLKAEQEKLESRLKIIKRIREELKNAPDLCGEKPLSH